MMNTNRCTKGHTGKWLLAIFLLAPVQLAAKGCDTGLVGDDTAVGGGGEKPVETATGGASLGTTNTGKPGLGGAATGGASAGGASGVSGATSQPVQLCGGLQGASCGTKQYCRYELVARCGAADQTGTCASIPEACDLMFAPVCGCDDKTYGNDCVAATAGVSVAYQGECNAEPTPDTDCGGLTGKACSADQYCKYAPAAKCGAADQMGTCTAVPEVCDQMYAPVCGCDDKTYANDCAAAAAGVSVAHGGACVTQNQPTTDCGGLTGKACAEGQYCKFALAAQCGAADQMGTCATIPGACDRMYAPVCGCDDKTYSNACVAAAAGISVAHDGDCVTENAPSTDCGGLTGKACAEGQYCKFALAAQCGAADQMGTCTTIPQACNRMYAPVCGCDDKTYSNACVAAAAGISVAHDGDCVTENAPSTDCGGLTGKACGKGQYCNYDLAARCGAADQMGTCASIPEACLAIWTPVCGCDNKTYSNECSAAMARVAVASSGECPAP